MSILACGINHKTAPVELREQIFFAQEKLALYLHDLIAHENIREAVLLSTCNRSELYCNADDITKITDWFCRQHPVEYVKLKAAMYFYQEQAAVEHIMNVACGLDSMALGESQVLGQMKAAFSESCAAGVVDTVFNRLFQQIFAVAKEVRANTAIGACPVSVASAAIHFIKQVFPGDIKRATVLMIGGGVTVELALRQLKVQTPSSVIIANRHPENVRAFAEHYSADIISLTQLPETLMKADIVLSATGSPAPIVTKKMFSQRTKPLVMMDIAVPRDIEASVGEIEHIKLYSIDDLKEIIQQNLRGREHAAEKAHEMIKQKSQGFIAWLHSFEMVTMTICAYRKQIENLCQAELTKALRQLEGGDNAAEVLTAFAHALTNKVLHTPSVQLRQAGFEGRVEILQFAQQLFAIPT